ncbi:MAG: hypothetical protein ACYTFW_03895 [Planctomycetota bacterium]|jgi:hypothetical protein
MSKIDENKILNRLKLLSQANPNQEAANHAIQQVREALILNEKGRQSAGTGIYRAIFNSPIIKFAAAAVLLIGFGFIAGQLLAPRPLDVEELQAALEISLKSSLEPAIRQDLLEEINNRWQSAFAANRAQLKDELQQQVRRDLTEFAAQTLAASGTLTDQRLMELVQLIEAARVQDRRRVEEALEQIELNRLRDKNRLGNGLVSLAAQTNELLRTKQN